MRRLRNLKRGVLVLLGGALSVAPCLQARTCGGAGDVVGSYGWLGVRTAEFVPVAVLAPGTNVGSSTALGSLIAGTSNAPAFASVGRLYFDGNGGVFATAMPGAIQMPSGTYGLNGDCTMSMTLTDAFATPAAAGLTPTQGSATFEGIVVKGGNEIDLIQTGSSTGTTLTLRKARQSCTIDILGSAFGIIATGVATTPTVSATGTTSTPVSTPFSLTGRFVSDGAGNLVQDAVGLASPLTNREITGTYTVNGDCTGTATLTTADGKKRGANFVIVTEGPNFATAPLALQLAFSDSGVVGSGIAHQQ